MILFIRKVFCFISLIILIICLFISLFFTFYKTPNTPRKKIFLGDSTSKASIDTKIAKEYENYSQGGEAYLFTYFKLKRLNETQKLDTILINFSPLNIINNEFEKAGVSGRQRYLPIIESEGHIDLFKNNPIIYLKSWLELGKDFFHFTTKEEFLSEVLQQTRPTDTMKIIMLRKKISVLVLIKKNIYLKL